MNKSFGKKRDGHQQREKIIDLKPLEEVCRGRDRISSLEVKIIDLRAPRRFLRGKTNFSSIKAV